MSFDRSTFFRLALALWAGRDFKCHVFHPSSGHRWAEKERGFDVHLFLEITVSVALSEYNVPVMYLKKLTKLKPSCHGVNGVLAIIIFITFDVIVHNY